MEVDWGQHQLDRYAGDSERALKRLHGVDVSLFFLDRAVDLLTNYLSIPEQIPVDAYGHEVMARLTHALYNHIWPRGYWDQISRWWPKMVAIAQQLPDPDLKAEIILELSVIKNNLGEVDEALDLCQQLITSADFQRLPTSKQANLYHHLGICCIRQGDYETAEEALAHCLTISEKHNLWDFKGFALNQFGNLAMFQGDFSAARQYYEASLATFEANEEDNDLTCVAYQSLGRLLVLQQQFSEAIPLLEKGLVIRRRLLEQEGTATNAVHLATAYLECGRLAEAEMLLNEALVICKELNYLRGIALCYLAFGQLETKCGHRPEAIAQYQQALDILKTTPMPPIELQVLAGLLPQLLWTGQFTQFPRIASRLLMNLRRQRLSLATVWRLAIWRIRHLMSARPP